MTVATISSTALRLVAPTPSAVMRFTPRPGRLTLPDVRVDLLWDGRRLTVQGPQSRARISRRTGQNLVLLSFAPVVAFGWLRTPLSELVDQEILLSDLVPRAAAVLTPAFEEGRASPFFVATDGRDARLLAAARSLSTGRTVSEAASDSCLSERQLERRFQSELGLRPKSYSRIVRLRRAIEGIQRGAAVAEAALNAGYSDQSHLSNDAKSLTGATLRGLLPNVGNLQELELGGIV